MRFFHQAARRAAVLLLCLSMLTGMLIPAFAATTDPATETPAHNLVYTDNQDENHDPIYKVRLTAWAAAAAVAPVRPRTAMSST